MHDDEGDVAAVDAGSRRRRRGARPPRAAPVELGLGRGLVTVPPVGGLRRRLATR